MIDYLDGASRDDKPNGGTWTRQPAIGVLHSTETDGWPSYSARDAPHLTVSIVDRQVRQHVPFTRAARGLQNKPGGVETNRAGAIQLEIIGTCDHGIADARGVLFLPELHDDQLAWLATVLHAVHEATGVPLTSSVEWRDYKSGAAGGSYGKNNGLRLSTAAWNAYTGWLGHMHVPENDHGDPGNLDVDRLLKLANAVGAVGAPSVLTTPTATAATAPAPVPSGQPFLGGYPLPAGHYFGLESHDPRCHSGLNAADSQSIGQLVGALGRRGWKTPGGDLSRYSRAVMELVKDYQRDAKIKVDGLAGPVTWTSISQSPIRK